MASKLVEKVTQRVKKALAQGAASSPSLKLGSTPVLRRNDRRYPKRESSSVNRSYNSSSRKFLNASRGGRLRHRPASLYLMVGKLTENHRNLASNNKPLATIERALLTWRM
jgi:hypothetical protein